MAQLSTDQYHLMIKVGILVEGAPFELIDGMLVEKDRSASGADPKTVGFAHTYVLSMLGEILHSVQDKWHARTQQPVTIPPHSEPEPDGMIVRGTSFNYMDHHPEPSDVSCVIEVADRSLQYDRMTKQRIYADAGIPQYVIVNLVDRVIEVYVEPIAGSGRYAKMESFQKGQSIRLFLPNEERLDIMFDQILR